MMKKIFNMSLGTKVLIGFVAGILIALIFQERALIISPLGDLFLNLILMIVVPLVFFSIISGITSLDDFSALKSVGLKVVLFYIATTAVAGTVGLIIANVLRPGSRINREDLDITGEVSAPESLSLSETLLSMIPRNVFQSFVEGNLMQIIVFAIFVGIAIVLLGEKASTFKKFVNNGAEIMYTITGIVMKFSPIGVAALISTTFVEYGSLMFGSIATLIIADYVGLLVICFLVYAFIVKFIAKSSLKEFYKAAAKIWPLTMSTTSSSGTLPYTMNVVEKDLKVPNSISKFSLPIGSTINMDGAANFYPMAVVFVSQLYGFNMTLTEQITIVLIATLLSIGSPGIPGGGIVMVTILLTTMGLPLEIMGVIAGIYRIIDMGHTTLNVTGDMAVTLAVANIEERRVTSVIEREESTAFEQGVIASKE
ncbi:dicarboxylate/amino acid:cation symporter [Salinicoccus hispanicus]|uniref:Cation:dicarboxylase symporter family transporter n=1 Tax=Salinicoccus hispanicus TaxID=157225 RepID=A0A6N8TZJ8_9STAP|nr:dicarboxylate/amino acid:cation symporter [Salinicoccus hispanicus]MXQ50983.1 cation:dicarboxylase symporter family transporter [Salinicoccus hispanicus]